MYDSSRAVPSRRESPRWYEWLIAVVALLALLVYFVVKPAMETAMQGFGAAVSAVAQGVGEFVAAEYEVACFSIEQDPQVIAHLGEPIEFPTLEQVRWPTAQQADELTFTFTVSGPQGSGDARVVAAPQQDDFRPVSIVLIVDDKCLLVPPLCD